LNLADRIQKVLASAGIGSRREIERWIAAGRVIVDGRTAKLGDLLSGNEKVFVDGRAIKLSPGSSSHSYLAYYKPSGELTTRDDPERRPTVFDLLPRPMQGRWVSVGRLDMNTSGLLLLTTDGALAHRLMHPRYEVSREYAVRLLGEPSEEQWRQLTSGVQLEDGTARFEHVEARGGQGVNTWFHVTLKEGRNREVRRMFEALNLTVSRLLRVRYGPVELGRLKRGTSRLLTDAEIDALYAAVDLARPQELSRPSGPGRSPRQSAPSKPPRQSGPTKPTRQSGRSDLPRPSGPGKSQSRSGGSGKPPRRPVSRKPARR
jgi:23S rRNA pseudouridine2605 synthase